MPAARTDFWELERRNRRETAILVVVFIALFTALGFGLDFRFHDIAIVDGSLTGFPLLTLIALGFGIFQSLLSYYGGASLGLAPGQAPALSPPTPPHQIVPPPVHRMAPPPPPPLPTPHRTTTP